MKNRKKIIVHLGFNKCGSTTFQHTLRDLKINMENQNIFYFPDEYLSNNFALYDAVNTGNSLIAENILDHYIKHINKDNWTLILSCENFSYLADSSEKSDLFKRLIESRCDIAEYILLIRNLGDLVYSNTMQLINNGLSYREIDLANQKNFYINLLQNILKKFNPIKFFSIDELFFMNKIFYKYLELPENIKLPPLNLNQTRKEFYILNLIKGQILHLYELDQETNINSESSDKFRIELDCIFDEIYKNSSSGKLLKCIENYNEILLKKVINKKLIDFDKSIFKLEI